MAGASPRRRFFQVLWHHTPEAAKLEKERLQYFGSAEGRDDLYRWGGLCRYCLGHIHVQEPEIIWWSDHWWSDHWWSDHWVWDGTDG